MMNSVLPFLILSCVLYKNVVSLLSVVADDISPADGATVKLTCTITPFSVSSSWINNMTTGILSTCDKTGFCSRINFGRYSFSSNSSAIIAEISGFNAAIDDFGWKCLHDAETLVFKFTLTTTTSSPTSTPSAEPNTTTTMTTTTTNTTTTMTTTTTNTTTTMTTTTNTTTTMTSTTVSEPVTGSTTCPPPPVLVIVGVTVSGFLVILIIFIICCCCCPCCCLYRRMQKNADKQREEDDKEDAKNHEKTQAYPLSDASSNSSTSDKYKDVQSIDVTKNQSNGPRVEQTCTSDLVKGDKSAPNNNDNHHSMRF